MMFSSPAGRTQEAPCTYIYPVQPYPQNLQNLRLLLHRPTEACQALHWRQKFLSFIFPSPSLQTNQPPMHTHADPLPAPSCKPSNSSETVWRPWPGRRCLKNLEPLSVPDVLRMAEVSCTSSQRYSRSRRSWNCHRPAAHILERYPCCHARSRVYRWTRIDIRMATESEICYHRDFPSTPLILFSHAKVVSNILSPPTASPRHLGLLETLLHINTIKLIPSAFKTQGQYSASY
jgi:hypothetical protein